MRGNRKYHISPTLAAALLVGLMLSVGSSVSAQPDPALAGEVIDHGNEDGQGSLETISTD